MLTVVSSSQIQIGEGQNQVTVNAPSGIAAGNDLFCFIACSTRFFQAGDTAPAGWTLLAAAASSDPGVSVLHKKATSSEPATYTFGAGTTGGTFQVTAAVLHCSGVSAVGAAATDETNHGSTNQVVAPSVAANANDVLFTAYAYRNSNTGVPSSWTGSGVVTINDGSGGSEPLLITDRTVAVGGQTGTSTATMNVSGYGHGLSLAVSTFNAPYAPTLVSPANGATVGASTGVALTAVHNSADGTNCNAYLCEVKASGAQNYSYFNAATGTLQSTPVWNPCSVVPGGTLTVSIPAGVLADLTSYNWTIAMQSAGAQLQGPAAPAFTFNSTQPPAYRMTGPSGSVTDTATPLATWTTTPTQGAQQTGWQIVWESGAVGTVPGSGVQAASLAGTDPSQSARCPTPLNNGVTYRQFGKATETGGVDSAWDHVDFTLALTPPGVPSLTATPGTDPTTGAPRVVLVVTGHDAGGFTYANTTYEVQSSPDGTTWVDVRGASALAPSSSDTATVSDYEAPLGQPTSYRARTIGTTGGNTIASNWSVTQTATPTAIDWWLTDPAAPSFAVPARIDPAQLQAKHGRRTGVFAALGRKYLVVVSDSTIGARAGTLNVSTFGAANWAALNAILDQITTLLLRSPWGDVMYLVVTDDWTDTFTLGQRRDVAIPFVEVGRP